MSSQKPALAEFTGCLALLLLSGLLPLLKVQYLDFPASLSLSYGLLLLGMREVEARTLNPALALADIFRGHLELGAGLLVILAQFAGAAAGAFLLSAFCSPSEAFPAAAGAAPAGQLLAVQLVCGAALAFAHLRGAASSSKFGGPWLGALMYGSFAVGGEATAFLNPAVALGVNVARGVSGGPTDEALLAVVVLGPLLAAGLSFVLEKASERSLQLSELVGTFFLSFGILAAAAKGGPAAAVGLAFFAAAVVRMIAPLSGGSLNPAVSGGALLSEGRSISREVATVWLFQVCGALAAALLLLHVGSSSSSSGAAALASGDWKALAFCAALSALLMISYCTNWGDFFGSPAAAVVGAVYGLSIAADAAAVPVNPATSLGAAFAAFFKTGTFPDPLATFAAVFVPVIGCMAGAVLLRAMPSEYRRRL
ncbi:aquaporin, putative [Eimeria tenella]|uniref:Aquaporin, putative n=1 Tax=Eimeria tenella TaxID=5802 RepID=U6KMX5_EIMTE|nr:aquaporin, putative [Eimeria tenella]CDJ39341.1 aquaporin, putative [Eimeria tenella]|eukprot:XP_013230096.1 aquaporin, putative [Eimeria tenella]